MLLNGCSFQGMKKGLLRLLGFRFRGRGGLCVRPSPTQGLILARSCGPEVWAMPHALFVLAYFPSPA